MFRSSSAHDCRAGSDEPSIHDAVETKPVNLEALLDVIGRQIRLEWQPGFLAKMLDHVDP